MSCLESHQQEGGGVSGGGADRVGTSRAGTRIDNPVFCSALFQRFKDMVSVTCRSIRWKIKMCAISEPLPMSKGDATKSMCLARHAKGTCNSNCPLSHNYISYNPMEYVQFKTWCDQHFKPE